MKKVVEKATEPKPRAKTMLQVMKLIDTEAVRMTRNEQRKLWYVLTALRGPDNNGDKWNTTAVIRAKALPQWSKHPNFLGTHNRYGSFVAPAIDTNPSANNHFARHAMKAAEALKLV